MANITEISTDTRPRWMKEIRSDLQEQPHTRNIFAHSYGKTDLLMFETASEERLGPQLQSATIGSMNPMGQMTAQLEAKSRRIPRAKRISALPEERYILLKKYEGFVTARNRKSFMARLFESASDYPVVEAEFDLEELSESDRTLAVDGAAIVWTIGYRYEGSTRKRESVIYLRRLPGWNEEEVERAKTEVNELTRDIHWK